MAWRVKFMVVFLVFALAPSAQPELQSHLKRDPLLQEDRPIQGEWREGPYASQYNNCQLGFFEGTLIVGCEDFRSGGIHYGTLGINYWSCEVISADDILRSCQSIQPDTDGDLPRWDCSEVNSVSNNHVCYRKD